MNQARFALLASALLLAPSCQELTTRPDSVRASESAAPERPVDIQHYAIDLELFPTRRTIEGSCRIRLTTRGAAREVGLHLEGLDVRSVTDASGAPLSYRHSGADLVVELPAAAAGETEITIAYGGRPITGLWYSGVGADGTRPSQVWTQGQAEESRGWFPCYDHPSDRATSELRVRMPADWIGIMPGERVSVGEEGGKRVEHWSMTTPHPSYLTSLVAGEFVSREGEWDGIPLSFYAEPEYASWIEASFADTDEILAFLSNYTGIRYPYSKYSQVCVANYPWGGMENISATTLTPLTLGDALRHRDQPSTELVAHEAAHQWFGDLFTCDDWSHLWLNEGFATYLTLLYFEETRGEDEFRARMRDAQEAYLAEDVGNARRPTVWTGYSDPEELFDTRAYEGAAARLNLLRFLVGDADFQRGVRTFAAENQEGNVVTGDLKRAMEKVSGEDLSTFFEQWIYGSGFPEFDLAWSYDPRQEIVRLEVRQTHSAGGGTPSVFRLPVDVEVRDQGGSAVHRVNLAGRTDIFELPVSGEPLYVVFDHGGWIPKKVNWTKRGTEWLAIAHESTDVNARRDAARALGEACADAFAKGRVETLETIVAELAQRLSRDESPWVRADAARALGHAQGVEARERLQAAAQGDPETRVRIAALEGLAMFPPSAGLATFGQTVFDEAYSYDTMIAAARLVCAAMPTRAYGFLTEKMFIDSPHDVLRAGLLTELGELEPTDPVVGQLRRWAQDETTDPTARAAAVRELGEIGGHRAENGRFIAGFLDTENFRLRQAAIEALAEFKDESVRRTLRAYYPIARTSSEKRAIEAALASTSF